MIHLTLCLALASLLTSSPQSELIPLDLATDDDGPAASVFSADERYLFTVHMGTGSITRLDLLSGVVDRRIDLGVSLTAIELTSAGAQVVVLDPQAGAVHLVEVPSLQLVSTTPFSTPDAFRLLADGGGANVVVEGPLGASVVDLALAVEARTLSFAPRPAFGVPGPKTALAANGRTLTVLEFPITGTVLRAYDILTGALTSSVALHHDPQGFVSLVASGDRSTVGVVTFRSAPALTSVQVYDANAPVIATVATLRGVTSGGEAALNIDGTRAFVAPHGQWHSFPLNVGSVSVGDPGVASIDLPGITNFRVSADETRVALWGSEIQGAAVADTNGTVLARLDVGPLGWSHTAASPITSQFAFSTFESDRLDIVDASSQVPRIQANVNSGFRAEVDGPLDIALARDGDSAFVAAADSDTLLRIDFGIHAVAMASSTDRDPITLAERADQTVLVGHANGELVAYDPLTLVELTRVSLGGSITDIDVDSNSTEAIVRTSGAGNNTLYLVETGGANPGVLAAVALGGSGNDRRIGLGQYHDSIVVHRGTGRAYAVARELDLVEVIDLATMTVVGQATSAALQGTHDLRAGLTLSPDGLRLFAGTARASIAAFDVTAAAPIELWNEVCASSSTTWVGTGKPVLTGDGRSIVVDLSQFVSGQGSACLGLVVLDAATGAQQAALGFFGAFGLGASGDDILGLGYVSSLVASVEQGVLVSSDIGVLSIPAADVPAFSFDHGRVVYRAAAFIGGPLTAMVVVDLFDGQLQEACAGGTPNATGVQAQISVLGSPYAGDQLELTVAGLQPGGMLGMLVVGDMLVAPTPAGGGLGQFCVGGAIGRLTSQVQLADAAGEHHYAVDTDALATSVGTVVIQPGDSWTFQGWYRDSTTAGAATSNTSTAVQVTFR